MESEKTSYGAFERFIYLFLIPVVFTVILTGTLLAMFGYDVMDSVLRAANKVPVLEYIVPDPKEPTVDMKGTDHSNETASTDADHARLTATIAELETELLRQQALTEAKDSQIEELQAQLDELLGQLEAEAISQEQYVRDMQATAKIYADMSASKAAPILERMGTAERTMVLSFMPVEAQTAILQRMNPATAAETSLSHIAELKKRLEAQDTVDGAGTPSLSREELGRTIAGMTPARAADLLLVMASTSQNDVIAIMRVLDVQSRAAILSAMTEQAKETAAVIAAGLEG